MLCDINITQHDIDYGVHNEPYCCPAEMAISRFTGGRDVFVYGSVIVIDGKKIRVEAIA
jgi:hypothetical protein